MTEYERFIADNGEDKRYDYPLNEDSLVFDVGGYKGDFTYRIHNRYKCWVYVFEPVPEFYNNIVNRFIGNHKIKVFPYGLSNATSPMPIHVSGDSSSMYTGDNTIDINLMSMDDLLANEGIDQVDLLKINIEGDEYALLRHIIADGLVGTFDNIQVQFHEFIFNCMGQRNEIVNYLLATHERKWNYNFIWESWKRKIM